jgi:hypothetical protein
MLNAPATIVTVCAGGVGVEGVVGVVGVEGVVGVDGVVGVELLLLLHAARLSAATRMSTYLIDMPAQDCKVAARPTARFPAVPESGRGKDLSRT